GGGQKPWRGEQWAEQTLNHIFYPALATKARRDARVIIACSDCFGSTTSSLGQVLGLRERHPDDLYRALDWLYQAQPHIEQRLPQPAPG
ncbi:MAG: hypothetical protein FWF31_05875, partial [Desulfobulbus sp.]|nr:hypothetical protein [Desulfobulbus sp.]